MAFKRSSNSAGGLQAAFDSGTPAQKAAFQASVSGYAGLVGKSPLLFAYLGNSYVPAGGAGVGYVLEGASGGMLRCAPGGMLGVSGNTSAQMLARVESIPAAANVVFFGEGPNDINASVSSVAHAANLRAIGDAIVALGKTPVLVMTPPKSGGLAAVQQYRAAEYYMALSRGWRICDPYAQFFDPATGVWAAGASDDGTHLSPTAESAAGLLLWDQVSGVKNVYPIVPLANGYGVFANNLFLTDAGADGVADGWSTFAQAGATFSLTSGAGDGIPGNWQTTTAASVASGNSGVFQDITLPAGSAMGHVWALGAALKCTRTTAANMSLYFRWMTSSNVGVRDEFILYNTPASKGSRRWDVLATQPAGASKLRCVALMSGTAYTGSISIGAVCAQNLSLASGM